MYNDLPRYDMDTYSAVRDRLLVLCEIKRVSFHKLAMDSGVPPSTIKNILYGKSKNPGIVTIKMLCDGLDRKSVVEGKSVA